MSEYQIEIKQLVNYPRCRIYRGFIRQLMRDRSLRSNRSSYLYAYTVLCSYVNYRSSYRRIEGTNYLLAPGEWICRFSEMVSWLRVKRLYEAFEILEWLQANHYITFSAYDRSRVIKFSINDWEDFNTALENNYPCQKETGFFFFPFAKINELVSAEKCSDLDVVLDLWLHTIYNDDRVEGSPNGPVVYYRNGSGNPLTNYAELGKRWGMSKATAGRTLKRLEQAGYIALFNFAGRTGSVIYLKSYLSTMFHLSDVMLDKEEVAMSLNLNVTIPTSESFEANTSDIIAEEQISDSAHEFSVSKWEARYVISKAAKILAGQGLPCCSCQQAHYYLSRLSDCAGISTIRYRLRIDCKLIGRSYDFDMRIEPVGRIEK